MSKTTTTDNTEEEDNNNNINNHDNNEECFYDSLDRIVSSTSTTTSCSCSNSDDENDVVDSLPVPKFPTGVSTNLDVWISRPVSVSERRFSLLRQMGLAADPTLTRGRSVPADHSDGGDSNAIFRSKSHGSGSSCCSSSASVVGVTCSNNDNDDNIINNSILYIRSSGSFVNKSVDLVKSGISKSAGSLRGDSRRVDEIRCDSIGSDSFRNGDSVCVGELGCNEGTGEQVCKIKNLDDGTEFVVNEVREDGMWKKLKEVGTGRQLTLEEFEMSVGHSPIVRELMRRRNVEDGNKDSNNMSQNGVAGGGLKLKKKGSWLKSLRSVANTMRGHKERRSSDERDTSSERSLRRSSSATDDSQDVSFHGPEKVKVRQYGKSYKELSALYRSQEIQAHKGPIWSIKFSLDGRYLASAGDDCVIHVWQVVESERKGDLLMDKREEGHFNLLLLANGSSDSTSLLSALDNHMEKKRKGRTSFSRKSVGLDRIVVPETVFGLSEKPVCSFQGHLEDVLDLSWSKSQHLLSSSMDKTVRLWHLTSKSCLKVFSHSDYVTCIQFNPVDDRYFISGSLDAKVRIWSIPDRQVVDWNDVHEMITAACYTPDGQGALVGSDRGNCRIYTTYDNKLQRKSQIKLQKKKKSHQKKITGFQFVPGSSSEVLITSADSRIRVFDDVDLVHKFKGFRNTTSQISASLSANGKYVVAASEDSHVYVWKNESHSRPSRSKSVRDTRSYEHFHCRDVSVAIPWPGLSDALELRDTNDLQNGLDNSLDEVSAANHPPTPVESAGNDGLMSAYGYGASPLHGTISSATNSYFFDRISATWPEEKLLLATRNRSPRVSLDYRNSFSGNMSAWGMVIVTAGLRGEIRTFQNFGLPERI